METLLAKIQRMDEELKHQVVYKGFTKGELDAAFDAVKNPTDWRAAILARVAYEALAVTVAAIEFFTATEVSVSRDLSAGGYKVYSIGYRAGPAGDH